MTMRPFMYRCPSTGYVVGSYASDVEPGAPEDNFEAVECPACKMNHQVDPTTGELREEQGKYQFSESFASREAAERLRQRTLAASADVISFVARLRSSGRDR
jgi:hypothetical protein